MYHLQDDKQMRNGTLWKRTGLSCDANCQTCIIQRQVNKRGKEERDVLWLSTNCLISLTLSWKNKHSPGPLKHKPGLMWIVLHSVAQTAPSSKTTEISYLPHTGFAAEAYTSSTRGQVIFSAWSDSIFRITECPIWHKHTPEVLANEGSEKCLESRFRCVWHQIVPEQQEDAWLLQLNLTDLALSKTCKR